MTFPSKGRTAGRTATASLNRTVTFCTAKLFWKQHTAAMEPKTSQYKEIWSAEDNDHEEFLSETDVESGHEKEWRCDEVPARRKWDEPRGILSTIKAYSWIMNTALLLIIVGLLTVLLLREPHRKQIMTDFTATGHECASPPSAIAHYRGLMLTCAPVSTSVQKWNADAAFVPLTQKEWFSDAITEKWNTLMPGKQ